MLYYFSELMTMISDSASVVCDSILGEKFGQHPNISS